MEYYIYVTNGCNLGCSYCSVLFDPERNHIPMKPNYDLGQLICFIRKTQSDFDDKDIRIFFFGGEPTMDYDFIARLSLRADEEFASQYNLKLVLHTNGLLLDKMPENLINKLSLVIISFNYEKIPAYNLKESYFSRLLENSMMMKRHGVPVTARLTITEKTSLFTAVKMVEDYFDETYFQIENCSQFTDFRQFYRTYTFEMEMLFNSWVKKLESGYLVPVIPFMAIVRAMFLKDREIDKFCCGYGWAQIYVQTDGRCYACCDDVPESNHLIGDIHNGIKFGVSNPDAYHCKGCEYRNLCMGRCGRMHHDFSTEHINEYCQMNSFMFDLFRKNEERLSEIWNKCGFLREGVIGWNIDIMELIP